MLHILWEFKVKPGCEGEFEVRYGAVGDWAQLFASAEGFVRTALLRDPERPGRYITIDVWRTRAEFEIFLDANAARYAEIDAACDALTTEERFIGTFDTLE
jgi:heme-degrading monooxygenase HmoA